MRCIVVDNKTMPDPRTKDPIRVISCFALAHKYKGGLWHHLKDDGFMKININSVEKPEEFGFTAKILPGQLLDVTLGVNEFTGKKRIASYEVVADTDYLTEEILYL